MAGRVSAPTYKPMWKPVKQEKQKSVPIKKVGKIGNQWLAFARQWKRDHKPDWAGNYPCTDCGNYVHASAITLDHRERRGSHPDLRFDETNIVPLCAPCHVKKDSGFNFN